PVLATMVMLAFVVLGLFSYQRLAVDQFPNIDLPTVVVAMDYPGASPEIVESEVTKKIEEAVNTVAGISSLYSRSYEGTAVVIIEFDLSVDGRKAADDVREKVVQINARLKRPEDFREIVVARRNATPVKLWQVADVVDGPQEVESLALYNGQRTVLLSVQKSQGENTIAVVDGLQRALAETAPLWPPGVKGEVN